MLRKIDWESQIGRRLRLRDLHVFFMVVQQGSMAKAAAQLRVSQPAVSEVIADLEHALGVRLLDRSSQGVAPTVYGDALLKRIIAAFDELKQSVRDIEFLADPTTGELKISCPPAIAATVLSQVIERFSEKYPRVVLHIDDDVASATRNLPALRARKYDLILARGRSSQAEEQHLADDLNIEFLFDDPLVVAAGLQTGWARRRKIDLAELVDEPWIMQAPHTWNYQRLAEAFRARGLDMPKARLVTLSMPLITHFLANGQFITAFPRSVVRYNALKVLPVDLPTRIWPVTIVTLKNRTLSPVVDRFIECAREVTKAMAGRPGGYAPHPHNHNVA
jgi:DNA-binding transcriptional LysR family regulator